MKQGPHHNKPQAVALYYDGKNTPTVTATGKYDIADQIIAIAREHGVPLYENPQLVDVLAQLELGESIPETLYLTIAEIIAFAYYIQGKQPSKT